MNEPKPDAVSFQIDDQRPIEIAVAIPTHNRHRRTDIFQRCQDARRANIPEMPDFIRAFRQRINVGRQMIVRIGQDKNFHFARWIGRSAGDGNDLRLGRLINIERSRPCGTRSSNCVC